MIEHVISTLLRSVSALVVAGAVLGKLLCDRLESHHPEVWKALGEPSLFSGSSFRAQHRISRFVRHRDHENLEDERLDRIAGGARLVVALILSLILLAVVLSAYHRS